jgi:molybdopterin converting factor small subunit
MPGTATVTVHVPPPLRYEVGGAAQLELRAAASVRALLLELERAHPLLHRNVCDETGRVRRHVNLFVNSTNILYREGLETPLVPGDAVTILPAVSGG